MLQYKEIAGVIEEQRKVRVKQRHKGYNNKRHKADGIPVINLTDEIEEEDPQVS